MLLYVGAHVGVAHTSLDAETQTTGGTQDSNRAMLWVLVRGALEGIVDVNMVEVQAKMRCQCTLNHKAG